MQLTSITYATLYVANYINLKNYHKLDFLKTAEASECQTRLATYDLFFLCVVFISLVMYL